MEWLFDVDPKVFQQSITSRFPEFAHVAVSSQYLALGRPPIVFGIGL